MNALWQIILRILWRLRPVRALEVNLHDIIQMGFDLFTSDETLEEFSADAKERSILAAALFDAHRKVDMLIYLRACELTNTRHSITRFNPCFTHTHNSADITALWRRFQQLVAKFDDYERLAKLRASRLRREANTYPLRLAASLQSTSPALCTVEANSPLQLSARFASTSALHWGRWIARACAQDGGGRASARGPPQHPIFLESVTLA